MINENQAFYLIIKTLLSQNQCQKTVVKNTSIIVKRLLDETEMNNSIYCPSLEHINSIMNGKPALHRFPNKMARYIYLACWNIYENFNNSARNVFFDKENILSKDVIIANLCSFKGISSHKAEITYFILNTYLNRFIDSQLLNKLLKSCCNLEYSISEEIDYLQNIHHQLS